MIGKRFVNDGVDPMPGKSPEDLAAFIRAEYRKWGQVIKTAGIKPE